MALVTSLLAACSSGGDASLETTATTPTVIATTQADPTTTVAPTTTEAPTTTIDPAQVLAAQVEADLLAGIDAITTALQDPTNDEKVGQARDLQAGSNLAFFERRLSEFLERGYQLRPNPTVPAEVTIEVAASLVDGSADFAELRVCEVDSWVTVEPGAGPNGSDAIVDPDVLVFRSVYFMRDTGDRWKIEGSRELGSWEGVDACPPA